MMSSRARKDVIPPAPLEYEISFTSRPVIGSRVSEETA